MFLRHGSRGLGALAAIGAAACTESAAPPLQPGGGSRPATVSSWSRTVVQQNGGAPASAAGVLVIATDSGVAGIDPSSGTVVWRTAFPPPPVGVSAVGNVVRIRESVRATFDRTTYLDAATGVPLWSTVDSREWQRVTIATTDTMMVATVNDTSFLARDRHTGDTMWSRTIPIDPCLVTQAEPCYRLAGMSGPDFMLVRFNPGRAVHALLRLTPTGTLTVMPFTLASPDTLLQQSATAVVDASGTRVLVTTAGVAVSLDATSGTEQWRRSLTPLLTRFTSAQPVIVRLLPGMGETLLHLVFTSLSPVLGDTREVFLDIASGAVTRERSFGTTGLRREAHRPCGPDGIVLLLGGPGFTYVDSRSGRSASGVLARVGGAASDSVSLSASLLTDWPSGHLTYLADDRTRLVGFRCQLALN